MLRVGHILIYLAIAVVLVGLISGFAALFAGFHDLSLHLLFTVPAGVLLGFVGFVIVIMLEPRQ
jgi:hypothetical protein